MSMTALGIAGFVPNVSSRVRAARVLPSALSEAVRLRPLTQLADDLPSDIDVGRNH